MEKYHLTLSDLNPGVIFSGLVVYCNDSVVLAVLLLFLGLLPCIATIGFFFGIRRVFRFLRHVPVFVIVFSIIFFVITLGLILQIAYLIGAFVMVGDFLGIRRLKKTINTMADTLAFYRHLTIHFLLF
ncbi:hypothetical protein FAEUMB_00340 [Faecalimonas umbilicata]|uniref:ABC transmembrane type-1 domain-containing protein n=2 Tax=Faecalimonas umbilicata TaxID=1912855 RepID=A0ABQ0QSW9_9FIRM|nr:hypothetical protein FAEUMB_00340 [Faecalimonas umbilicata]